jgi:hypothetical protein
MPGRNGNPASRNSNARHPLRWASDDSGSASGRIDGNEQQDDHREAGRAPRNRFLSSFNLRSSEASFMAPPFARAVMPP